MSDHTKGPWDYFVGNANGRGLIRIEASHLSDDGGHHIASMPRGKESEANARLIASAPELYEALKEIESLGNDDYPHGEFSDRAVKAYRVAEELLKRLDP